MPKVDFDINYGHPVLDKKCPRCGEESIWWIDCPNCGGSGFSSHDCGEDCCVCIDPEPNVVCDWCGGKGGHEVCINEFCEEGETQ